MSENPNRLLLNQLNTLLESQFATLLFQFKMPPEHLPPGTQAQQAIALIRYAQQQQRLNDLAQRIADFLPTPAVTEPAPAQNPFGDLGRISDPARYFARAAVLHEVFDALRKGVNLSLLGPSQSGKSSLLEAVRHAGPQRLGREPSRFIYLNLQGVGNDADFFAALAYETGLAEGLGVYKLGRELKQRAAGQPFVLSLDEVGCLSSTQFSRTARDALRSFADGADAPLTLLIASRAPLDKLFPDNPLDSSPLAGICQTVELPPFSEAETRQFLESRLAGSGLSFSPAEVQAVWRDSGGNPRRVQELAAAWYRRRCPV